MTLKHITSVTLLSVTKFAWSTRLIGFCQPFVRGDLHGYSKTVIKCRRWWWPWSWRTLNSTHLVRLYWHGTRYVLLAEFVVQPPLLIWHEMELRIYSEDRL